MRGVRVEDTACPRCALRTRRVNSICETIRPRPAALTCHRAHPRAGRRVTGAPGDARVHAGTETRDPRELFGVRARGRAKSPSRVWAGEGLALVIHERSFMLGPKTGHRW